MERKKSKTNENCTKGVEINAETVTCKIENVSANSSFTTDENITSEIKCFYVPRLIESFRGRDDELKKLSAWFFDENKSIVVISGFAGCGKTQLALRFAEDCIKKEKIKKILWINSESEESIKDSFRNIYVKFNGNKNITNITHIVEKVCKKYNAKSNLFVFDNAANRQSIINFEPPKKHQCLRMITSHVTDWGNSVMSLPLLPLSVDNAVEVLRAVLQDRYKNENLELYKQLVSILSCVPLALEMAAAYIREEVDRLIKFGQSFNLRKYVKKFEKSCAILIHKPIPTWSDNSYNKSIYRAIEKSLHKIVKNREKIYRLAVKILHICAYLNSENILFSDIMNLFLNSHKSKDITTALIILSNNSFIMIDNMNSKIIIHRLIQEFLLTYQKDMFKKHSNKYYFACLEMLFTDDNHSHYYSILKYAKEHIITFKKFYLTYDQIILKADIFFKNIIEAGCNFFFTEILNNLPNNAVKKKIDKYCLLHKAVRCRQHDMLNLLLDYEPNINKRDDRGKTPLLLATWLLDFDAVEILLNFDSANIKATDEVGWSILHTLIYAFGELHNNVASKEACNRFRWLEERGADINAVTRRGETVLHVAAAILHPELVECLIEDFGLSVHAVDTLNRTPLCQITSRGWHPDKGRRIRTAQCLVNHGAKLDVVAWRNKTPAQNARAEDIHDLAKFLGNPSAGKLVSQGSEVADILREHVALGRKSDLIKTLDDLVEDAVKNINDYCLLHVAAAYWQHDVLELLLARGADVNNTGDKKVTPLFLSACELNLRAVQLLVKHGAEITGMGYMFGVVFESRRPQFAGRENEICDVLRYLWKHGAITTWEDRTLLHEAAKNLHTDLIPFLIREFNLDVNAGDRYGQTPLHYISDGLDSWKIKEWRGIDTAQRLVKHGARLDVMNVWRQTPAQFANARGLQYFESWLRTLQLLDICLAENYTYTNTDTDSYSGLPLSCEFTDLDSDTTCVAEERGQRLLYLAAKLNKSDSDTSADSDRSTNSDISQNSYTASDVNSEKSPDLESQTIDSYKVRAFLANENNQLQYLQQQYLPRFLELVNAAKDDTEEQRTSTGKETCQSLESEELLRRLIISGSNKSLIKKLAEFEDQVAEIIDKYSLVHTAVRHGQIHALVILAMHRPNINNQDVNNDIALHIAARELNLRAVKLLLFFEASIGATNEAGWSVLHEVVAASHQPQYAGREAETCEMLQWLADHGAYTRALAPGGATLLHFAAYALNEDLVDFLVHNFKLDVNAMDMAQQTPIYWICFGLDVLEKDEVRAVTTARCLLELGALAKVANKWNNAPAEYARAQGHVCLAACIEKFEAQETCKFSIQLDESTLPNIEALLLLYVRFIKDETIHQELLFAKNLESDTKGESIFNTMQKFFQAKEIPICNILSAATDGAPAMTGRHKGFIAHLKQAVPNVLAVHCIIHRQHLVAKI